MSSVSVILPVYNVRPYLRTALDSLLAQTVRDWTAICVDDGSTDGSGEILEEYAARDGRITVVHQPNGGLCSARNAGLDRATGEVVLFFDPDDAVGPQWMERLVRGIDGVDLAWGGFVSTCEGKDTDHTSVDVGREYLGADVKRRVWRAVFGYRLRDVLRFGTPQRMWRGCGREFVGLWSRAYRRSVIGDLRFDEALGLFEDAMFVAAYAERAQSMRVIGETGYRYAIRVGGLMSREGRERKLLHKFELRDARRRIDPKMTHWRGSFLLSAVEVFRIAGLGAAWRYLRGGEPT